VQKGGPGVTELQKSAHVPVTTGLLSAEEIIRLNRSEREDRDGAIGNDDRISASC
jgi:hypothetical protein